MSTIAGSLHLVVVECHADTLQLYDRYHEQLELFEQGFSQSMNQVLDKLRDSKVFIKECEQKYGLNLLPEIEVITLRVSSADAQQSLEGLSEKILTIPTETEQEEESQKRLVASVDKIAGHYRYAVNYLDRIATELMQQREQ